MRFLWVVTFLLAMPLQVGCGEKSPAMKNAGEALPGCLLANEVEMKAVAKTAEAHFRQAVGVEVTSMDIGTASVCGARFVVPIEATTPSTKTPRIWFVEINRNNPEIINLIRPE